ncbi:MAG: SDR family NAD(P)-dependent oxidoreductase [Steroidobacteraceae bacterium]
MDLQLRGRKAIVTGATKGIGLAIAKMLADEGVDLAICARTAADVEATVKMLAAKGVKAYGDALDVQDRDAYTRWIESAL